MSYCLKMTADELLNESIMGGTPIIIVEGNDDISIYENIIHSLDKDIEVYASENIKEISQGKSGCSGVKNSLKLIESVSNGINYERYILGIIDRDVTTFRGDDVAIKGLFVLRYYSIESHFITQEVIPNIINNLTLASMKSIDINISEMIFSNILEKLYDLYYISLEALKNACIEDYDALFRYKDDSIYGIRSKFDFADKKASLDNKINDLDIFAEELNLELNLSSLLLIVKGKWILEDFIHELNIELKKISALCKAKEITQCQFCINEAYDKCLYKISSDNKKNIKMFLFNYVQNPELDYIRDRIKLLG